MPSIRNESELKSLAELAIECFDRWAVIHKLREVPPSEDVVVVDDEAAIRTEKLYALLGGDDGEVRIEYPWDLADVFEYDLARLRGIVRRVREVACINPPAIAVPYVEVVLKDGSRHVSRANPTCKRWRIASEDGFKVLQDYKALLDDLVNHIRFESWGRDFAKAKPEPCVRLMGPDQPPVIRGKQWKRKIGSVAYTAISCLIERFPNGMTKDELERKAGDFRGAFRRLEKSDEQWEGVLISPGIGHGTGYRLAPK